MTPTTEIEQRWYSRTSEGQRVRVTLMTGEKFDASSLRAEGDVIEAVVAGTRALRLIYRHALAMIEEQTPRRLADRAPARPADSTSAE